MQVLRVLSRHEGESGRTELPYALRRPQRPSAPQMDALGLARHLAVSDVQVRSLPQTGTCVKFMAELIRKYGLFQAVEHPYLHSWNEAHRIEGICSIS